jgi:hypothetical protein
MGKKTQFYCLGNISQIFAVSMHLQHNGLIRIDVSDDLGAETESLTLAVRRILRPLVRLLLRHGVSFHALSDLLKQLYVEVAEHDFVLAGRKQSASRISTLTGLPRKEVKRAQDRAAVDLGAANQQYNRAARVLTGWSQDARFHSELGGPRTLPFEGELSFTAVVREFSGDVPPRAIADELLRVGAIKKLSDGRLQLIEHAYVPGDDVGEKLHILGTDVAALIATIDHNIYGGAPARFQRKVEYSAIASALMPEVRHEIAALAQASLEQMDEVLQAKFVLAPDADDSTRTGVGIYYFEERNDGDT